MSGVLKRSNWSRTVVDKKPSPFWTLSSASTISLAGSDFLTIALTPIFNAKEKSFGSSWPVKIMTVMSWIPISSASKLMPFISGRTKSRMTMSISSFRIKPSVRSGRLREFHEERDLCLAQGAGWFESRSPSRSKRSDCRSPTASQAVIRTRGMGVSDAAFAIVFDQRSKFFCRDSMSSVAPNVAPPTSRGPNSLRFRV